MKTTILIAMILSAATAPTGFAQLPGLPAPAAPVAEPSASAPVPTPARGCRTTCRW